MRLQLLQKVEISKSKHLFANQFNFGWKFQRNEENSTETICYKENVCRGGLLDVSFDTAEVYSGVVWGTLNQLENWHHNPNTACVLLEEYVTYRFFLFWLMEKTVLLCGINTN